MLIGMNGICSCNFAPSFASSDPLLSIKPAGLIDHGRGIELKFALSLLNTCERGKG